MQYQKCLIAFLKRFTSRSKIHIDLSNSFQITKPGIVFFKDFQVSKKPKAQIKQTFDFEIKKGQQSSINGWQKCLKMFFNLKTRIVFTNDSQFSIKLKARIEKTSSGVGTIEKIKNQMYFSNYSQIEKSLNGYLKWVSCEKYWNRFKVGKKFRAWIGNIMIFKTKKG